MAKYLIADLTVEMDVFGITRKQAAPYALEEERLPDITIQCDPQAVLQKNPGLADLDTALYMGTGSLFARYLLDHNGFQLHASAVVLDGKAYLFSAPPGTGKSTHTAKWCRLFGASYINDDKPALRLADNIWYVYGTPWSGKHDLSSPCKTALGGIAFLHRGEENTIRRLSPEEAVAMLISQSPRYLSRGQMSRQLDLLDRLLRQVPVWRLDCKNEDEAAILSHAAMTGGE